MIVNLFSMVCAKCGRRVGWLASGPPGLKPILAWTCPGCKHAGVLRGE